MRLMRAVIPAAGLGTRFLPMSRAIPKEMLPLGEWPVIHHALIEAEAAGFRQAIIVISPAKRAIRTYFEAAPELERELDAAGNWVGLRKLHEAQSIASRMQLSFIEAWTRGPGEAVLLSRDATGEQEFAVLLPDDVVPSVDHWTALSSLWQRTGSPAMTVRRFDPSQASRFGIAICEPEGGMLRVRHLVEKPPVGQVRSDLRIFGRYIVTAPVLDALEERRHKTSGELQLTEGYAASLGHTAVYASEFAGEYFDCGTPADFAESTMRYARRPQLVEAR
jgi:UTP--glucose-1-phosphate uridylyltransferase